MSIKNQLRAAILSGGAKGSGENIESLVTISTASPYVAPSDGTVYIKALVDQYGGAVLGLGKHDAIQEQFTAMCNPDWANALGLSVRKGDTVSFLAYNMKGINAVFVKLVGGGKNPVAQLIRRVVPCLKITFDQCLSRIEKRTEVRLIQQLRYKEHSLRYLNRVMGRFHTLPPLTGWLRYSFRRVTCTTQFALGEGTYSQRSQAQLQQVGQRLRSSLRREQKLLGLSVQESALPLPLQLVLGDSGNQLVRNLCLGGASHA